jgi:hypothetical protein
MTTATAKLADGAILRPVKAGGVFVTSNGFCKQIVVGVGGDFDEGELSHWQLAANIDPPVDVGRAGLLL